MPRRRWLRIAGQVALWAATLMLVMVFAKAGWGKFTEDGWARAFRFWGYPAWFRVVIGIAECAAALLLIHPRSARFGALTIVAIMAGAMMTHVIKERNPAGALHEVLQLVLALVVCVARWPRTLKPPPA